MSSTRVSWKILQRGTRMPVPQYASGRSLVLVSRFATHSRVSRQITTENAKLDRCACGITNARTESVTRQIGAIGRKLANRKRNGANSPHQRIFSSEN